ncbi:hypothetical protein B7494_g5112 [Chlorociboria aeruginascens]|nr:hypothetical protein B7494_g5112 [Chlorociboria aeruginascens]
MLPSLLFLLLQPLIFSVTIFALPYDPEHEAFNLNTNKTATDPLDYHGQWTDHAYQPSPKNWRFPVYTIFLDRFANGDPTNDNANGTAYEHDLISNQFRNGGDVKGLLDSLDYLHGMGIKGLYLAGSPHINQPWAADGYSPLDLTLLDHHFGNITAWQEAITQIHSRGMYVILDNTFATLGDLIGFDGYLNTSTPFSFTEHNAVWKSSRRYHDFQVSDEYIPECTYPRFWDETGAMVGSNVTDRLAGCRKSEFDQMWLPSEHIQSGKVTFPLMFLSQLTHIAEQLSKFGFVQDRLREWRPNVLDKIKHFSCITIKMLDIDGFRIDKALTITSDAQADWSDFIRGCAKDVGKDNFFIPGEIVSGNTLAALYLGRGKEPQMALKTVEQALLSQNLTDGELFIRDLGKGALDAAAFHYSIYRSMTRFLGIDGVYAAELDTPINWVDGWQNIVETNDLVNQNTGVFDPRHMYGVTNQDVFRWPALTNGTEKNLVGLFITTMILPGIPTLMWGEEQASYVLENTAGNYIFGRSPMTSSLAWQVHGCYAVGSEKYNNFPLDQAIYGCLDDNISLDHRDPSHPIRNILKRMYELRTIYPVLNDGFILERLSNKTYDIFLPGSGGTPTETGLWSVLRARADTQDFTNQGMGNQSVWIVYGNENRTITYSFNCSNSSDALIAPFDTGTVVKNLFYPYDEYTLINSTAEFGLDGSFNMNGCLPTLEMPGWGFKAFVPIAKWVGTTPSITKFSPGHDYRMLSKVGPNEKETVGIQVEFSQIMDCESVVESISMESNTEDDSIPVIDEGSIKCVSVDEGNGTKYSGGLPSVWTWSANLINVANGVHSIVINNPMNSALKNSTGAVDRFLFRVGQSDNPMVFPRQANYSDSLMNTNENGSYVVAHKAAGASKFRYSIDWESSFSDWLPYSGGNTTLENKNWTGTKLQSWKGEHVYVQYWSSLATSSNHFQHGDLGNGGVPRRIPHLFVQGPFNQFSFDTGISGTMAQLPNGTWYYDFMTEWPASYQLNEWGMNPDGQPDQTLILGDIDHDHILDRLPPGSLVPNMINITEGPPSPYTAYRILVNDGNFTYEYISVGNRWFQLMMFIMLSIIPILTAGVVILVFIKSFYHVKFNELGASKKSAIIPLAVRRKIKKAMLSEKSLGSIAALSILRESSSKETADTLQAELGGARRKVLIATMEYDIEDWAIKIKIGGLGVMAQLMGKALGHQDLVWVVPCVADVDYPFDQPAKAIFITILDKKYEIQVQYHVLRNITYVLLDAPIFRKQSRTEPYPARMDDLESAIYYSAWNQCIAETINRFNPDIYHINDYHGACAPLYLLPRVIPCALSLHNAEFQGLWPMRTSKEREEVCMVYNLKLEIVQKYVQFGEIFNLLHAGASYLRIHQKGFGAVGVSKKYGKRTFARYPIFWGLSNIGSLPNPDPTDTAEWERDSPNDTKVAIDWEGEAQRPELKRQAQVWANLKEDPDADLFVFVGRWSMQKGVDLIADVFPSILESYPSVQLMCIGPLIDHFGRFAALKLEKMMELYPGRVYSKPEFTALPPFIFSGSEFALIPSRDEPFGLVAVEFGRKGALGVGARVGGLGQMPGWWYSIESMTPKHLVHQFKMAIHEALASPAKTRAVMRARSALQRFPVVQWVEDLDSLQSTSIRISEEENIGRKSLTSSERGFKSPQLSNLRLLLTGRNNSSSDLLSLSPSGQFGSSLTTPQLSPSQLPSPGFTSSRSNSLKPPAANDILLPPQLDLTSRGDHVAEIFSTLSYDSVAGGRDDFALQKVDATFTDASGVYLRAFEKKLEQLGGKSSENLLCIEENLMKSEISFFKDYRDVKMGLSTGAPTRAPSIAGTIPETPAGSFFDSGPGSASSMPEENLLDEFPLGAGYKPPTGVKRLLLYRIADWPLYAVLLAFGQIIAANSYQITLLIGEVGETALQLYIIATIYAVSSICWWVLFRSLKSVYCLSIPFIFYGSAFFLIGTAPFATGIRRGWIQNVATGFYAIASSSGSLFFALNFGDEGGAPIKSWVLRACLVQGTQQLYISALWYWGSALVKLSSTGVAITSSTIPNHVITAITVPIAGLMWIVGVILFLGLPKYYRQAPGQVPSFYKSVYRRKIILWFFITVIIQNYWLSAPYGRNWRYLWTTQHAPAWAIAILVCVFFILIWTAMLVLLARLSRSHSWILPVFAIGLGAPRWCQMLWGTSGAGQYLPWAGSGLASALLGRCLWLWLGVLDALQGVGFGMILLQTMTRFHITFTLVAAQVLGSVSTILARLTAPDNTGPGPTFPNFALGPQGLSTASFWLGLLFQIMICVGFAQFFRKEQLSKP